MATHDYVIANGTGAAVRSDLNGALAAIVSNNSSATEPATMYAYQQWADTTTGLLKIRNSANSAWVTIGTLASTNLGLLPLAGGTMTGVLAVTAGTAALPGIAVSGDTNTGIYSPGADQLAISNGGVERMRIHSTGYITYGTGAIDSTGLTFGPTRSGTDSAPTLTWNGSFTGTVTACDFLYNGARQGSITTTISATAYNTSSDYRLKENVANVADGIARLQQLNPSRFNFIADPDRTVEGFLAHEAQAVVPECVTGEKDAVDADGNPVYQGIDQSKLVPLLTAALQEAIARIETLETRLSALEGA